MEEAEIDSSTNDNNNKTNRKETEEKDEKNVHYTDDQQDHNMIEKLLPMQAHFQSMLTMTANHRPAHCQFGVEWTILPNQSANLVHLLLQMPAIYKRIDRGDFQTYDGTIISSDPVTQETGRVYFSTVQMIHNKEANKALNQAGLACRAYEEYVYQAHPPSPLHAQPPSIYSTTLRREHWFCINHIWVYQVILENSIDVLDEDITPPSVVLTEMNELADNLSPEKLQLDKDDPLAVTARLYQNKNIKKIWAEKRAATQQYQKIYTLPFPSRCRARLFCRALHDDYLESGVTVAHSLLRKAQQFEHWLYSRDMNILV